MTHPLRNLALFTLSTMFTGCEAADDLEVDDRDAAELDAEDEESEAEQPTPEELALEIDFSEIDVPFEGDPLEFSAEEDPTAIGELACATASIADARNGVRRPMSPTPACGFAWDSAVSPDTSYNPAGCPNQFITEVTGTSGRPLGFFWNWHGASLDATTCNLAHATLATYGQQITFRPPFSFEFTWSKLGETRMHGRWIEGFFSWCTWEYDAGWGPLPTLPAGHTYFAVRTAALATGFLFKQRVEGGISHGAGPC